MSTLGRSNVYLNYYAKHVIVYCILSIQSLEELNLSSNGITVTGLKALDGVLQSNVVLKTLNLSGNPIGEEGAKVYYICFTGSHRVFSDCLYKR